MSYIDELERIQKLKEKNILTQEEFETEKKKNDYFYFFFHI